MADGRNKCAVAALSGYMTMAVGELEDGNCPNASICLAVIPWPCDLCPPHLPRKERRVQLLKTKIIN